MGVYVIKYIWHVVNLIMDGKLETDRGQELNLPIVMLKMWCFVVMQRYSILLYLLTKLQYAELRDWIIQVVLKRYLIFPPRLLSYFPSTFLYCFMNVISNNCHGECEEGKMSHLHTDSNTIVSPLENSELIKTRVSPYTWQKAYRIVRHVSSLVILVGLFSKPKNSVS